MRRVYTMANRVFSPATGALFLTSRLVLGGTLAVARLLGFFLLTLVLGLSARLVALLLFRASEPTRWQAGLWHVSTYLRLLKRLFGLRLTVEGHRPAPGSLVVSNHRSYLDIAALGALQPCFFLSKAAVARWPVLGPGARAAGIPFVRRGDPDSRRQAVADVLARLRAGFTLVNFPEGTTSARRLPLPFKAGLFHLVAGTPMQLYPARIAYGEEEADWVGDATFLDHLFRLAMQPRTLVRVSFSEPVAAAEFTDGEALRDVCYERVCRPRPVPGSDIESRLWWLRAPWRRQTTHVLRRGAYRIRVLDQPGRWMSTLALADLTEDLRHVAASAMDETPTYGVFTGDRDAYANRVIAVAYTGDGEEPVAFTAMVYLPFEHQGHVAPVIHLGLTMIAHAHRGKRLQTPLFKKIFLAPILNQLRLSFPMTNIAASPAGIGAASDYFMDTYPDYRGHNPCTEYHRAVADQVLGEHRHEFGCSERAVFDPETFVVHGSNDPTGGGAHQFIKTDPVSRYRVEACNEFCRERLDFLGGDELFQVGRVDFVRGMLASRASKRGTGRLHPASGGDRSDTPEHREAA